MASEQLGDLLGRIHAGFRRTLGKGALLSDPAMLTLHQRLLSVDPKKLQNQPLRETRFVVVDTETTGLQAYAGDEICSIALIEMRGLERTGREFNSLIFPGRSIPAASSRIHHLTDADVQNAPVIEEVMEEIIDFIGESVLVGHHIGFDMRFLNKLLRQELLCHLKHPWLDTMLLYLVHTGRVGHYTLEEVADHARVEVQGRHTARGDAITTAEVFKRIAPVLSEYDKPVHKLIHQQYELGHF
ncbi:PolC-type DNA polymerase III [Sedimenticola thiotaurini]|uniref:DNA-directed DNA polymerase n=1 Tax=Sedimenticola thiotaurini TaxID=1543721 RepID=A0A0F7K2S5_9GAMM|nr:3'-5' exonuclease [Sedimenticola thiotaurini]AKH21874.1 hypothetical protein AAY24_17730 [Sedimenticola thiotaurini]